MPTITLPINAPRYGGLTLELRTELPVWIVRWKEWMGCSLPFIGPDGKDTRVLVSSRLGIETAIANSMAVEIVPEHEDPNGQPILIRPAAPAPTDRANEWKSP